MDYLSIIIASVVILYFWYRQKFLKRFELVDKLPGPRGYPIIGNALDFVGKSPPQILKQLQKYYNSFSYHKLGVFRIGTAVMCLLTHPETAEVILSSQKFLEKSDEYDFISEWLASGLLTSTGSKWFARRKVITPTFHFKILDQFVEVFDKNSKILVKQLSKLKGQSADIFPLVTLCALDVICETSMGVEINAQIKSDSVYVKAVKDITELLAKRNFNFLKRSDFLYSFFDESRQTKRTLKILHEFTDNVIKARRQEILNNTTATQHADDDDVIGTKRKLALLDVLLQSTINGNPLNDLEIREEVDTFVFEGHDTTTSGIAFCLYNLAKNPKIQEKCIEEIRDIIGDDLEKSVTLKDLTELKYLELVIKESLRLYPSVPFYGRKLREDLEIDGKIIPAGANIGVGPYFMGRDEKIWKNPLDFNPERFEAPDERIHPYAHIAFSAGPRNCIGQKFAMLEMKSTVSKVLRNFELKPSPGFEPILVADLILRPENGIQIIMNERKY